MLSRNLRSDRADSVEAIRIWEGSLIAATPQHADQESRGKGPSGSPSKEEMAMSIEKSGSAWTPMHSRKGNAG